MSPFSTSSERYRVLFVGAALVGMFAGVFLTGCTARHYRASADKEAYKILQTKQKAVFGQTNEFSIDTRYSHREVEEIKPPEIIEDRLREEKQTLTLGDALKVAVESNRQYQLRKENLYIAALNLTGQRHNFRPQFFAGTSGTFSRSADGQRSGRVNSDAGLDQALKAGGRIGLSIANDLLRFYTGDPRRSAVSAISLNLFQPLLRGAGAEIAAENLTQAERNVIYEIRDFTHYQNTFAVDIVSTYLRLLQQQDTVRNEYANFQSLVRLREQTENLVVDRLAPIQADQAKQNELSARSRYILAVERYEQSLDGFKLTLGLPLGYELHLDESALKEIEELGLIPVSAPEKEAYDMAITNRLDLLNEIDAFEDTQRRVKIAANRLKADLSIFANGSLPSEGPTDYTTFDINDYSASAGIQLDLPFDRLPERNSYRSSLLAFERQIRTLALFLDDVRDSVRQGLRTLLQARQSYEIQRNARDLADRRVENAEILLDAGQGEVRDVLEAQDARISAYNAVTQTLLDYHLSRLRLLVAMGVLRTDEPQFWLKKQLSPESATEQNGAPASAISTELIPPDTLFEN